MIFISHKTDPDHECALQFKKMLNDLGVETWIAPEDVQVGKSYAEEIPHALQKCEKVLFIFTEQSMQSRHVLKELDIAISCHKEIIPVQIGTFTPSTEFSYLLSGIQIKQWNEENRGEILSQLISSARVYEIAIQQEPPRKLKLIRGAFQENLDHAMEEGLIELDKTVIAAGIDRTGDLSISSTKGILRDLCQYLRTKFNYDIPQLQEYVNQAKKEQLNHTSADQLMEFGDCILIKLPVSTPHAAYLQFLFIANSQKNLSFAQSRDFDDLNGIDSREIVLRVFNRCNELGPQADTVFIGAMGTNGLSFPYEVIVAEIMNAFVYALKMGKTPNNLVFSVRNIDMERAGVTSQSIYHYVRNVVSFFC